MRCEFIDPTHTTKSYVQAAQGFAFGQTAFLLTGGYTYDLWVAYFPAEAVSNIGFTSFPGASHQIVPLDVFVVPQTTFNLATGGTRTAFAEDPLTETVIAFTTKTKTFKRSEFNPFLPADSDSTEHEIMMRAQVQTPSIDYFDRASDGALFYNSISPLLRKYLNKELTSAEARVQIDAVYAAQ